MTINEVILAGRFTADPEIRYTQNNKPVARFNLAVDRYNGENNEDTADFIPCIAWGNIAEFVGKCFFKGKKAVVKGNLRTFSWTDQNSGQVRYGWEVVVEKIDFADDKKPTYQQPQPPQQQYQPQNNYQGAPANYQQNPHPQSPPQNQRPSNQGSGYRPPQNPPPQNPPAQNAQPQYPWEAPK
mgnify:CR=1 FL=1